MKQRRNIDGFSDNPFVHACIGCMLVFLVAGTAFFARACTYIGELSP